MKVLVKNVCFYQGNPYSIGQVLEIEENSEAKNLIAIEAFVVCIDTAKEASEDRTGEKATASQNNKARKAQENK